MVLHDDIHHDSGGNGIYKTKIMKTWEIDFVSLNPVFSSSVRGVKSLTLDQNNEISRCLTHFCMKKQTKEN